MVDSNPINLLPSTLLKGNSTIDTSEVKAKSLVGFYFSAHWCPPCRSFTPILAQSYKEWAKEGKSIEIVFVSSDKSDDQMKSYFADMPWAAVPFDSDVKIQLKQKFSVSGIPKLVIVDANGKVLDDQARNTVTSNKAGAIDSWK